MKLKSLVIKNFRSFSHEIRIPFDDNLTVFVGKNDIGKSTILEALDIFFEGGRIKLDKGDLSVNATDSCITIGCEFSDFPSTLVLDSTRETSLESEYLLNQNGNLEVHKTFDCSRSKIKESIYAYCMHPSAEGLDDLLSLSISDLRSRMERLGVDKTDVDLRVTNYMA